MVWTGGQQAQASDEATLRDLEERANDPKATDKERASLLQEMKAFMKKLADIRKNEDPRMSFTTPEFKDAQRQFQDQFKKNFGRPIEFGLVKRYPWEQPVMAKLDKAVDTHGNIWVDAAEQLAGAAGQLAGAAGKLAGAAGAAAGVLATA